MREQVFISEAIGKYFPHDSHEDFIYSFPWSDDDPGLRTRDQPSHLLVDAVPDQSLTYTFPVLYCHPKPPPNVVGNRYRQMFNTARSGIDVKMQMNAVDVSTEADEQVILI